MKEILITSSVLIIVLLVLRAVFAKSVRRTLIYGTWLLVALRLLIPVQFGELSISVLNLFQPVTETITDISDKQVAGVTEQDAHHQVMQEYIEQDQTVFLPQVQEHIQSALDEEMPKEEIVTMLDKTLPEEEIYVPEVRPQVQEKVEKTADPITLGQILWSVWGIGAVAVAIWLAVSNLRFVRKLKKTATAIAADSPIPVFVTEKAVSPCLVGLFRPAVYLTPEVANNDQLRHYVMTHELTHYAHKDHIWSMVRCLCLCLYWFDPLVWIAAWYSRRDCELACDEGAMARLGEGQRIDYGKALLAVVQEASVPNRLMLTATAMAESKNQLRRRVNFIARKPHLSLFAAIALVLVCALVVGCVSTGAKPQPIAEDPIVEGPAITEPTESVTPTESVAPTNPVVPTETVIPTETLIPTETAAPTDETTAPTVENPSATTGVRPSVNIVPARPTVSQPPTAPTATKTPTAPTYPAASSTEETGEILRFGTFTYSINPDGKTCTIRGGASGDIPETIKGYAVTAIGYQAFAHTSGLRTVILPDTVTRIGEGAFLGCSGLTKVVLPEGFTAIPERLFEGCYKLTEVAIPESVTSIGYFAFHGCSNLAEITLPPNITVIPSSAFQSSGLERIVIPDGVTVIQTDAFSSCHKLKEVQIPDSVTVIQNRAFIDCSALEQIRLPKGLKEISSFMFESCRRLKQIEIPVGVTKIGNGAFSACYQLEQVSIPDSVTVIEANAFAHCSKLQQLRLPESITQIGKNAFYGCSMLEVIYYGGTVAQWNAVEKQSDWPSTITVQCADSPTATESTSPPAIRPTQVVTVPTVPTQSAEKVLEIYGLGYSDSYTDYSQFDAGSYNWMIRAAAEEWAAKNGYKLIFNGSYDQNKIITAMNSGERPDILFHSNTFPTIANLGLTTCFTPAEYQKLASICGEGYLDLLKIFSGSNPGSHGFVLPWADNVVCYYNATMFEEYGVKSPGEYFLEGNWNWDTFAKCMEQMTRDIDADGTTDTYGLASASWENLVNPWATSPTGQLISTINEPWMKAYFQLKYDAYSVKGVTRTGKNNIQYNVLSPMFAMQLSECQVYDFQQLYQTIPNGNKVEVVPVPAYKGNNILQFTQACASLATTCDQREGAVDLLAYILQCGMKYMSDYSLGALKCDYEGLQGTCQQSVWYLSAFQKALKDRAKALQKEFDYDEQLIFKMYDSFAEAQWYTKLNVPGVTALTNFTEIPAMPPASSIPAIKTKYQNALDQYNRLYVQ